MDNESTKITLLYVLTNILKLLHPFMPFVTEEIYSMLPVKETESIMISSYPIYNEENNYSYAEKIIAKQIEFIKLFRNIKLENKITSDFMVKINNEKDYDLIIKMLKITSKITKDNLNLKEYKVVYQDYDMSIYFEGKLSKEEEDIQKKQIESLKQSIERRKKLLSNENYVNKAPKELVLKEQNTLKIEEEKLEILKNA